MSTQSNNEPIKDILDQLNITTCLIVSTLDQNIDTSVKNKVMQAYIDCLMVIDSLSKNGQSRSLSHLPTVKDLMRLHLNVIEVARAILSEGNNKDGHLEIVEKVYLNGCKSYNLLKDIH